MANINEPNQTNLNGFKIRMSNLGTYSLFLQKIYILWALIRITLLRQLQSQLVLNLYTLKIIKAFLNCVSLFIQFKSTFKFEHCNNALLMKVGDVGEHIFLKRRNNSTSMQVQLYGKLAQYFITISAVTILAEIHQ